jgi:hypothetical protein
LTTLDLLDALEAGIAALPFRNGNHPEPASPACLEEELEKATLSAAEFARLLNLPSEQLNDWLAGRVSIPAWLPAVVQAVGLLPPSARRKLLKGVVLKTWSSAGSTWKGPARTHPFSRIEEL